jgi:hypothetical protein
MGIFSRPSKIWQPWYPQALDVPRPAEIESGFCRNLFQNYLDELEAFHESERIRMSAHIQVGPMLRFLKYFRRKIQ